MDRIVRIVTKNLISRLPSEKEFFRLDQLRTLNIPEFIIDRIRVEMDRNLDDSIVPPYTEWADMKNKNVQEAWNDFIEAIRAEARLPSAYAPSVVESAVSDSLDMLIQPRKKIPEMMFGADRALDRDTLEERAESVVVYKHLALAPVKYLYRKNLQALTYEQCSRIISTVDEKLVSKYNALNWAHLLEPLFELLGDTIDTNLLRIFFQDKKKPAYARLFDEMSSSITRSGLIEALSSPEFVDDPEIEELRNSIYMDEEDTGEKADAVKKTGIGLHVTNISADRKDDDDNGVPLHSRFMFDETAIQESESDKYEDSQDDSYTFNAMFKEIEKDEEGDQLSDSLYAGENSDEEKEEESAVKKEAEEGNEINTSITKKEIEVNETEDEDEDVELVKQFEQSGNQIEEEQENESDPGEDSILSETDPPDNDQEETYIWKNFLKEEDETEDDNRDVIVELNNENEDPNTESGETDELLKWIGDDRGRFIKEIFKDSEIAYEEAIESIAGFEEWKEAARFIEKEIFSRNLIDMYDEAAVDFTDRLHTYFLEFKSEKTKS